MKTKYYFDALPSNYEVVKVIDAKSAKVNIIFLIANVLLITIILAIGIPLLYKINNISFADVVKSANYIILGCFVASMFIYIVLHELTHGLFYKIFTHEKLKYGFTLTVAFCGVPDLYVKKIASLVTTLAPFVVYNIVFILMIVLIPNPSIKFLSLVMFAIHFGGCVGDLWVASYLLLKNRGKSILVNDTGPKQTFFVEKEEIDDTLS